MLTWYLLYGGESADGMGRGIYEGRTTDPTVAREHFERIVKNPYSTGCVIITTDSTMRRVMHLSDLNVPKP